MKSRSILNYVNTSFSSGLGGYSGNVFGGSSYATQNTFPKRSSSTPTKRSSQIKDGIMNLNTAKDHLKVLLQETIPVFLWGPPGIGKSSIVQQIAEDWKWELIDLRLSLLNPVDLRGLPYMDQSSKEAVWLRPEFLPTQGQGILFLDELNTAPTSVQIAAYQLLLDRRIGNYIFPEGWRIVAAGNREIDRAFVTKMPSPLANRLIHFNVEAGVDDWKKWAQSRVDHRIVSFINYRPQLLAPTAKEEDKAYPTPRSWNFVSRILKLYPNPDEAEQIIIGTVGEGAAREFLAFLRIFDKLPDPIAILEGKIKTVPDKPDVLYALCSALVSYLKDEYLDNFVNYTMLLEPEFATLVMKDCAESGWRDKLEKSKAFEKWVEKFNNYF